MGTRLENENFTDSDELGQALSDARSADSRTVSSTSDAQAIVDDFRSSEAASPWTSLDRSIVADRISELLNNPRLLQQGDLNLCGPAAFVMMWSSRDPVAFATYATQLFDTGSSSIGSLTVTPGPKLMQQDYAGMKTRMTHVISPQADWMVLGALRNSTDVFWHFTGDPSEEMSAMTLPKEIASWLEATGIYDTVDNRANWATISGIPDAMALTQSEGTDIAFLINANMLRSAKGLTKAASWIKGQFPNHFVVLVSEVTTSVPEGFVLLSVWTWGETMVTLKVPQKDFLENYYGAVVATMPSA